MIAELRRHPRINTTLEITYAVHPPEREKTDPQRNFATVTDMSKGGAGLLVEQPHHPGDRILIEGLAGPRNPLGCMVRWVRKLRGNYKIGVQFLTTAT